MATRNLILTIYWHNQLLPVSFQACRHSLTWAFTYWQYSNFFLEGILFWYLKEKNPWWSRSVMIQNINSVLIIEQNKSNEQNCEVLFHRVIHLKSKVDHVTSTYSHYPLPYHFSLLTSHFLRQGLHVLWTETMPRA